MARDCIIGELGQDQDHIRLQLWIHSSTGVLKAGGQTDHKVFIKRFGQNQIKRVTHPMSQVTGKWI